MKVVLMAGGLGTRLSEETSLKPKPMIEIGGKPVLWHIMKIYSSYGLNDFIVCLGYKGYMIKEYFTNYILHMSDITIDLSKNKMTFHQKRSEPWNVTLVDTGESTMTGGRLKRVAEYLDKGDFCMTYGDGVGDINIKKLLQHHKEQKKLATVTATQQPGRFGALQINGNLATGFKEKPQGDGGWINGGFFVLSPRVLSYIKDDASIWEQKPLERLAKDKQLAVYKHPGFWHPLDTLRDKNHLENLWASGRAPWNTWHET